MSRVSSGFSLPRAFARTLCALWLLFAAVSSPASEDDGKPLTAILLVGRPDLPDVDFADSVVLVMNNLAAAPVGIVLNRPTQMGVSELFPDLTRLTRLQDKVYFGGPVEFGAIWFLFRAAKPPEHAVQTVEGVYLSANRELLLRLLGRDKPMDGLRIFIGHAAWVPGQLESEIDRGAWTLERADSDAIFNGKSDHPWPGSRTPKRSI